MFYEIDMIGTGTALSRHTKRMEVAMSRVHPLKRIQVAAAAFAVMGLALAATVAACGGGSSDAARPEAGSAAPA
jgi:hypothetical protein